MAMASASCGEGRASGAWLPIVIGRTIDSSACSTVQSPAEISGGDNPLRHDRGSRPQPAQRPARLGNISRIDPTVQPATLRDSLAATTVTVVCGTVSESARGGG